VHETSEVLNFLNFQRLIFLRERWCVRAASTNYILSSAPGEIDRQSRSTARARESFCNSYARSQLRLMKKKFLKLLV
jgi:hypothetical protein